MVIDMNSEKIHFSDLAEYHTFMGVPAPEHPFFSVVSVSSAKSEASSCSTRDLTLSSDFYSISLKHIISGEIFYGRTKYDCKNGTMIFIAPKQEVCVVGVQN